MVEPLRGPFRFDKSAHLYTVGGVSIPGIHQILRDGGLEREFGYTEEHRERGKAVHEATLDHDSGCESLAWYKLPSRWHGYLEAYLLMRSEVVCRWTHMEHPKVNRMLRYASIIDRIGRVSGRPAVVELKTGFPAPFHGPQLAGADLLIGPNPRGTRRRMAIYLFEDGTYQLKEYTETVDYQRFLMAVKNYWSRS